MSRFNIDMDIAKDIMGVASDSFSNSIKQIEIEKIKPSQENFYSISSIDELADDIERQGLKHNLVVSEDKDNLGEYWLKSGHRRLTAIKHLLKQDKIKMKTLPCLIDGQKTKAETQLDLIMLNATSRVMNDNELIEQYKQLEKVFIELEKEGKKFKGRIRDRIANLLNVSSSQVGKIQFVEKNATDEVKQGIKSGKVSISVANEIAKLDKEKQQKVMSNEKVTHSDVKKEKEKERFKDNEILEKIIMNDNVINQDSFKNYLKYYYGNSGSSLNIDYNENTKITFKSTNNKGMKIKILKDGIDEDLYFTWHQISETIIKIIQSKDLKK